MIIKNAFNEGRETEIIWDKSVAKKNQTKLDVALENVSLMQKKEFFKPIPLHQIHPLTGKIINTFPSRIAAARYIVKDILKRPDKNPLAITGNMEMCMRSGWKAYGFYWQIATQSSIAEHTKPVGNAKRIFALIHNKGGVFSSLNDAAITLGISTKTIAGVLRSKKRIAPPCCVIQEYNPTSINLSFMNIKDAAAHAQVSTGMMSNWVKRNRQINNITYTIENYKGKLAHTKYTVYKGKHTIGQFATIAEVSIATGETRKNAGIKIRANQLLGNYNQYKVRIGKGFKKND